MKKRIIAFLLVAMMLVGIMPMQIFAATATSTDAIDTSWFDSSAESGTVFEIADAADLRGAAKLSQAGVTFAGYTLKLTANIDLNPGWDAEVKVNDGKATLPEEPTVKFVGFATFAGTFDGNGKTISGIYMTKKLTAGSANLAIFEILNGTVKNLVINNSFIYADVADGVNDCKIGGIAARTQSANTLIDTVYADINVWYRGWSWQRVAGIVAKTDSAAATFKNLVFAGTVGAMSPDYAVPHYNSAALPADMTMSQIIGDGNWKANVLENVALNGEVIAPANIAAGAVDANAPIGKCVGGSVSTTNVAVNAEIPAAVAAMNPSAYTGSLADFNVWPSATADSKTASYQNVKYYSKATESNYTSYLSTLESKGYTKAAEYTVGSNKYALFQKVGEYTVYVSYLAKVGYTGSARMRVFVQPFGVEYNTNSAVTSANVCDAQVWQLDVDNKNSKQNGGMSYVIRLTDGTFIVVDGGYATDAEATNLYKVLSQNNVNGGKPVITAWFITHAHNDHYGVLKNFAAKFASSVTVEAFYYNLPEAAVVGEEGTLTDASIDEAELFLEKFPSAAKYSKIHSGMTFGFAGVSATVLGTHEDVKQSYYKSNSLTANNFKDDNDTSTVIKFTIGNQTLMVLGDARTGMSKQLEYTYPASVLKSDMVQMAHHGYTGVQDSLYEAIDASVVLWPMDVIDATNDDQLFNYYLNNTGALDIEANDYVRKNADEIIPAYENACLAMPYAAKTYSGGNQTVDLVKAYNDKLYRMATEGNGPDTGWYNADKSVYYIYDANDLLGFANLAAAGNTFEGKTVMLMADIDLNEGWSADVTIGETVVFPSAPANVWPEISTFKGTLDGNGYSIKGLYKSMTAKGGTGVHGGMFNTFAGTMKNIKIENSFILTTNSDWGHKNVHVGGIAGNVEAGANLTGVYLDAEVWYKSHENCMLGGAFGFANGKYNVNGFVFAGRAGNTGLNNEINYSTPSGKDIYIAALIGCQNWKENNANLANVILTGELYSGRNSKQNPLLGADFSNWSMSQFVGGKLTEADLASDNRKTLRDNGWVYSSVAGSAVPGNVGVLLDGSYNHAKPEKKSEFGSKFDSNTYAVYTADELLSVLKSGGDFSGKTIMLMADIDLNPGWSADVTIGETVVFPSAPANVWPEISTFKGTLDGNGYSIKGLYKSMTAKGGTGVHGGMFNTFAGTMKNIKIENSFILTTNSDWGHKNVHVGGIAGNVEAGANLTGVYLDAEVWYKSHENCMLGGAFGFANGKYNVNGFVFAGRAGNTGLNNEINYSTPSGKDIYIAALIGCQNWKENNANLANVILTGELYSGRNSKQNPLLGADFSNWSMSQFVGGKLTEADLASDNRKTLRDNGWVYSSVAGSAVPGNVGVLLDGSYNHIVDPAADFDAVPEIFYQVSAVSGGKYDIRFLSGIDNITDPTRVGFDITLHVGGKAYKLSRDYTLSNSVYTSVLANGQEVFASDLNADYEYIYTCSITGIKATDNIVIDVAAVYELEDGTMLTGSTVTFEFVCGTGHVQ